jgi:hypothetical protein
MNMNEYFKIHEQFASRTATNPRMTSSHYSMEQRHAAQRKLELKELPK